MTRIYEFLIALGIVAVLALVIGLVLPSHRHISESVETNRKMTIVYDTVNNLRRFKDWNPLVLRDPQMQLNVTGPEIVSIRAAAQRLGQLLEREPLLEGAEAPTALLSNAARAHALFGYPSVTLDALLQWVAHWVRIGGPTLDKPTHYQEREGRF